MLRVRVSTASAEIIETELITAGRRGLECGFEFNSAWDGLAKTVIVNGVVKRDIVLVSDTITVPGECLAREQFPLRIGVYGANGAGEIVIPTIWANFGKILPSARPSGVDPDEVTPDIVAQIQTNSSDALRLAQEVMRRADSGEFDGRDGATGPSGADGRDGIDGLNGSSIWTVAAEDVHGGLILISDLVGRTNLTPAKNDLILDGGWNIYRIDLVGRSTVSATRFGNVGEGGGASGVFIAQYGVSTADEIYEASAGGNACILTYAFPGGIYYLSWLGEVQNVTPSGTVVEKSAVFTAVDEDEKTTIRVTGSTWFSPSTVKYARSASPTFTGVPKAPTAAAGTNTTQLATTAFVQQAVGGISVPTKTSDLTNDSGFVNASGAAAAAPVQSVNGQTGAVSVPSLPTGGTAGQVLTLMEGFPIGSDPVPAWENPTVVVFDFTLDADSQVTSGPTWAEVYNVADSKIVFARATKSGGSILLMPLVDGENYIFSAIDHLGAIHSIIPGQNYNSWEYTDNALGEDVAALWNEKLDNNLGSSEAGKFLVVGSDGAVTTMTLATWQGGSY